MTRRAPDAPTPTSDARSASISIIIPARDEARSLGATLARLAGADVREIIVADGRSRDDTADIARHHGAVVVEAEPGRGSQLNAGAAAASGDILLFLHADTRLPNGFERHVRTILAGDGVSAGAFRLHVEAPNPSLRLVERVVNWRSARLQRPYGDQGIFARASTFHRIGGFADLPLMEDVDLTRRLRREGRIEMAPVAAATSARRWLACGIWRTTLQNQVCLAAFHLGVSPARIAAWRRRVLDRRLRRAGAVPATSSAEAAGGVRGAAEAPGLRSS